MQKAERIDMTWDKSDVRNRMLARRHAYVEALTEKTKESIAINLVTRLTSFFVIPLDCVIGTYFPLEDEQNVRLLNFTLMGDGHVISYPRICEDGLLTYHRVSSPQELVPGPFGICQPLESAPQVLPDLFLTPLVAFDRSCNRIGYGKGHFDRTLNMARQSRKVLAIGIAYDMQKVEHIPIEPFDQQLDYVVTESQVFKAEKT